MHNHGLKNIADQMRCLWVYPRRSEIRGYKEKAKRCPPAFLPRRPALSDALLGDKGKPPYAYDLGRLSCT